MKNRYQNGLQKIRKCPKMEPKSISKLYQKVTKIRPKSNPKWDQKVSQMGSKSDPKWDQQVTQMGPKSHPKWYQKVTKWDDKEPKMWPKGNIKLGPKAKPSQPKFQLCRPWFQRFYTLHLKWRLRENYSSYGHLENSVRNCGGQVMLIVKTRWPNIFPTV